MWEDNTPNTTSAAKSNLSIQNLKRPRVDISIQRILCTAIGIRYGQYWGNKGRFLGKNNRVIRIITKIIHIKKNKQIDCSTDLIDNKII